MMIAAYGLSKHFPIRGAVLAKTTLKAVDQADLKIRENQIVGLVGESGSGKSTLGRCLVRLLEPTDGEILFRIPDAELATYEAALAKGDEAAVEAISHKYSLMARHGSDMRMTRREMNVVFQDPYSSLNPRLRLADIISEPMISTHYCTRAEAEARSLDLLREVGLPEFFEDRYPHELSGGQRQRVAVARAISTNPKLLILDEPTSALDVSVQAQILNMLRRLRDKYGISMLLITHNIAVVAYLAEQVYVMYAGKIMEWGDRAQVLRSPQHPYTKALMSAVPIIGTKVNRTILRGDPPNLVVPPVACRFHPRCPVAFDICGWTADEVVDDLGYVLTGKYFSTFGDRLQLDAPNDMTIVIQGTADAAKVQQVVDAEREESRSLTSIKSVAAANGGVVLTLHGPVDPPMYLLPDGRHVKCLLFRAPEPAAPPASPSA